jgi:hypothetical protein
MDMSAGPSHPAPAATTIDRGHPGRHTWPQLFTVATTGAVGVGMSWFIAQHSLSGARWRFIVLICVWVPFWLIGARAVRRLPVRTSLVIIVVLAALLRLAAATGTTPSISSDTYRYSWDAHVQLSGIDPYRYAPAAPQVKSLRTPGYWPDAAECRHIREKPGCTTLNRPKDRTIYPAVAEGWFVVVHLFNPTDSGSRPWQLAGGFADDGVILLLIIALRDRRQDPRAVAWYALSPLPVIEFAGNGHVDGFALLLLVAALIALHRERRGLAGVLVGMAIMVKLYPGLALAAGWRRGRWRFVLAASAVCVLTEIPHVIVVGAKVLGYIPGYLQQEKYSSGGRFLLLGLLGLPGRATIVLAVACVVGVAIYALRSQLEPADSLAVSFAVLMFVATPVQPWYAVAAAGIAIAANRPWLLAVPLAAEPYYATVIFRLHHQVAIGRLLYGAAAIVVIATWWYQNRGAQMRRERPKPTPLLHAPSEAVAPPSRRQIRRLYSLA